MSERDSRWTLDSTGNRVLLAVVIGLVVGWLGRSGGLTGGAHVVVFLVVAAVAYALLTFLRRR